MRTNSSASQLHSNLPPTMNINSSSNAQMHHITAPRLHSNSSLSPNKSATTLNYYNNTISQQQNLNNHFSSNHNPSQQQQHHQYQQQQTHSRSTLPDCYPSHPKSKSHLKQSPLPQHFDQQQEDTNDSIFNTLRKQINEANVCSEHQEEISLYCSTQKKLCCIGCAYSNQQPRKHTMVPLKTQGTSLLHDEIIQFRGVCSEKLTQIEESLKTCQQNRLLLSTFVESYRSSLKHEFAQIQQLFTSRLDEALLLIANFHDSTLKEFDEKQENLSFLKNCFQEYRALDKAPQSQQQDTIVYLFTVSNMLKNTLKNFIIKTAAAKYDTLELVDMNNKASLLLEINNIAKPTKNKRQSTTSPFSALNPSSIASAFTNATATPFSSSLPPHQQKLLLTQPQNSNSKSPIKHRREPSYTASTQSSSQLAARKKPLGELSMNSLQSKSPTSQLQQRRPIQSVQQATTVSFNNKSVSPKKHLSQILRGKNAENEAKLHLNQHSQLPQHTQQQLIEQQIQQHQLQQVLPQFSQQAHQPQQQQLEWSLSNFSYTSSSSTLKKESNPTDYSSSTYAWIQQENQSGQCQPSQPSHAPLNTQQQSQQSQQKQFTSDPLLFIKTEQLEQLRNNLMHNHQQDIIPPKDFDQLQSNSRLNDDLDDVYEDSNNHISSAQVVTTTTNQDASSVMTIPTDNPQSVPIAQHYASVPAPSTHTSIPILPGGTAAQLDYQNDLVKRVENSLKEVLQFSANFEEKHNNSRQLHNIQSQQQLSQSNQHHQEILKGSASQQAYSKSPYFQSSLQNSQQAVGASIGKPATLTLANSNKLIENKIEPPLQLEPIEVDLEENKIAEKQQQQQQQRVTTEGDQQQQYLDEYVSVNLDTHSEIDEANNENPPDTKDNLQHNNYESPNNLIHELLSEGHPLIDSRILRKDSVKNSHEINGNIKQSLQQQQSNRLRSDEVLRVQNAAQVILHNVNSNVPSIFKGSEIVTSEMIEEMSNHSNIRELIIPQNVKEAHLLYRVSSDGSSSATFHEKCDGKGATIAFVRSTNSSITNVFGWYMPLAYNRSDKYSMTDECYLFTIRNAIGLQPTKFPVRPEKKFISVYQSARNPCFGSTVNGKQDLFINFDCLEKSCSNVGYVYSIPQGIQGDTILAGSFTDWNIEDVEVYQLIFN